MNFVIQPIIAGVIVAAAWVVVWTVLGAAIAPFLAWPGYDSAPVVTLFFFGGGFTWLGIMLRSGG